MVERGKNALTVLKASSCIDLAKYPEVHFSSLPLVASIDHLVALYDIKEPRVMEIGPVPTFHYGSSKGVGVNYGKYDPDEAVKMAKESDVPPIWYLAHRHPAWHLAAVSTHDIPEWPKRLLLGDKGDVLISELGPERNRGINPDDVFDEGYRANGDIMSSKYPALLQKLGGRPNIILGRHVFDKDAPYLVGKLTTMAAMMLEKGGLLVSHVYFSGPTNSHVPLGNSYHFPFDAPKNMKHVMTLEFGTGQDKQHVFVYQKKGDSIRPPYRVKRHD